MSKRKILKIEAKEKILAQIKKGKELGQSSKELSRDNFELKFNQWIDFTADILSDIFVSSNYSYEFKEHYSSKVEYVGSDWVPDKKYF